MSHARGSLRSIIVELFPWLARVGLTAGGDLEIKSASDKILLAGGDAPMHRVGDLGTAGTLTAAANIVTWTGPDGSSWTMTFVNASPITVTIAPVTPLDGAGKLVTKATTGSEKVSSG